MKWLLILLPIVVLVVVTWHLIEAYRDVKRTRKYFDEIVGHRDIERFDRGFDEYRQKTDDSESR